MSDFEKEPLSVGDMILYYPDPFASCEPLMGWVLSKPGAQTVSVLCFSSTTGFVEKNSVRHKHDPFWKESESAAAWAKWGCYEVHPTTMAIREVQPLVTRLKVRAASK